MTPNAQLLGGPLDGREIDVPKAIKDIVLKNGKGKLHHYRCGRRPRRRKGKRIMWWEGETPPPR